jgi:hypothetical protein
MSRGQAGKINRIKAGNVLIMESFGNLRGMIEALESMTKKRPPRPADVYRAYMHPCGPSVEAQKRLIDGLDEWARGRRS